jgi:hypothetical protein
MGLTSLALVALLALLAAAVLIGAITFWRRLARPGLRYVVGRILVICTFDVVVVALILAIANRNGGFYASWSELLGTEHVSGHVVALGRGPVVARSVHGHDGQLAVTAKLPITLPGHPRAEAGRLLSISMTGPVSGIAVSGYLYQPESALHPATRHSTLPVIVVISDQIRVSGAAFSARRIAATAAQEMAAHRLRPALLVMLPASIAPGAGRSCLDVPAGPQADMFFAEDLPELVRSGFPASTSSAQWAVAADGTGSYCALQLALTNSAVYSIAAMPPGYYLPPAVPGEARQSALVRDQENLIYLIRHEPMQPISVVLTNGSAAAERILTLARPPMRVVITPFAVSKWPLVPVLDEIGHLLGTHW